MKKWVPAIGRKFWHRISHPFHFSARSRDDRAIAVSSGDSVDSAQSFEKASNCKRYGDTGGAIPVFSNAGLHRPAAVDSGSALRTDPSDLLRYLAERENCPDDIKKLHHLLKMPRVVLEIGCGNADTARQIALMNPGMGVIATDLYDHADQPPGSSGYGQIARVWRERRLPAQMDMPANLVILRAEAGMLRHLPERTFDTVFLINPEPQAGKFFLDLLRVESLISKIKKGPVQIAILPYSREMGVMACGGCGFEHDPDWSKGLGFIMGSGFRFMRAAPTHWGVDLSHMSAYTGNSTQTDVYVLGEMPECPESLPTGQDSSHRRQ